MPEQFHYKVRHAFPHEGKWYGSRTPSEEIEQLPKELLEHKVKRGYIERRKLSPAGVRRREERRKQQAEAAAKTSTKKKEG